MKIRCTNPGTKMIFNPLRMTKPVYFDADGLATVTDVVGDWLVKEYSMVEEIKPPVKKSHKKKGGEKA